jgi:hypothetical protein
LGCKIEGYTYQGAAPKPLIGPSSLWLCLLLKHRGVEGLYMNFEREAGMNRLEKARFVVGNAMLQQSGFHQRGEGA